MLTGGVCRVLVCFVCESWCVGSNRCGWERVGINGVGHHSMPERVEDVKTGAYNKKKRSLLRGVDVAGGEPVSAVRGVSRGGLLCPSFALVLVLASVAPHIAPLCCNFLTLAGGAGHVGWSDVSMCCLHPTHSFSPNFSFQLFLGHLLSPSPLCSLSEYTYLHKHARTHTHTHSLYVCVHWHPHDIHFLLLLPPPLGLLFPVSWSGWMHMGGHSHCLHEPQR